MEINQSGTDVLREREHGVKKSAHHHVNMTTCGVRFGEVEVFPRWDVKEG